MDEGAMSETDPHPEPPFSLVVDGKLVAENIRSEDAVRQQLGPLAAQQAGCKVQAVDRYGRIVAHAYEDERRRCRGRLAGEQEGSP
jgi:hypothetical protein